MLEKLETLKKGLDRANKNGVFTLEESSILLTNYIQLKQYLELEEEAKSKRDEGDKMLKPLKDKK